MKEIINKTKDFFSTKSQFISFALVLQGILIISLVFGISYLFAGTITVDAGQNRNAQAGSSILLTPNVADSDGDPLTYRWTCTGGSLSSSTALSPTLNLPDAAAGTIISCTLTADNGSSSASDSVEITITGGSNPTTNNPPSVDAGQNKTAFSGKTVVLLGDANDPDGDPLTLSWSCSMGNISNSTSLSPTFTAPTVSVDTTATCTLTATDNKGASSNDDVYISIVNSSQENHNPEVDAGSDKTVAPGSTTKLTPSVSDPDGDPLTYNWSCNGGSVSSSSIMSPNFYASSGAGNTATCTITVSDGRGGFGTDYLTITIGSSSQNNNPIVDAGPDKNIQSGASVKLTPSVSDPDGDPLTYKWSCNGGSLSSSNVLNPTFTANNYSYNTYNTNYNCTLTVTDSKGGSASDIVYIYTGTNSGICGSSNGQTLSSMPYYGLCNSGNPSTVSGSGPWYWTCYGINGGSNASCSTYANQYNSSNPIISSGGNREVNEGASVPLNVTAYDPNGYSLTYNWNCTGGNLSNYNTINPTYYAPMVNYDTTYYCTINVTNNRGGYSTANVSILVRDLNNNNNTNASVTTNPATNIKTTTARINGYLTSGNNANVRFAWGRVSSSMNSTTNSINKNSGDYFSEDLSGLQPGKAYQFRAEASGNIYGSVLKFITQPETPTSFNATTYGCGKVSLTWARGNGAAYTTVIRKTGSYPTSVTDGTIVYYGTSNSYTDTVSGGTYYYRAWSVGYDGGLYSWSDSTYSKDYVAVSSCVVSTPVKTVVKPITTVKKVEVKEEPTCEVIQDSALSLEIIGKNVTQKKEWSRNITANPGDEIDIQVTVASQLDETLNSIFLTNVLPIKIAEVSNVSITGQPLGIDISNGIVMGDFKPRESKVLSFRIKLSGESEFTERETALTNSVELNGRNIDTIRDSLLINVTNTKIAAAYGMASLDFLNGGWLILLIIGFGLFLLLLLITLFYLLFLLLKKNKEEKERERQLERERLSVERSKYFQIQ
ncbi:PKD domain-containing protein [bacterium]|nr:PKD domain-containing protein [bacterium]